MCASWPSTCRRAVLADWPEFHLQALLGRLAEAKIDFVVIGGIAAVANGSAAMTRDLDITYATDEENLDRLRGLLAALDARLRGVTDGVPFVPDNRTLGHTRILALDTPDGRLDLVARPDYAWLRERSWTVAIAGARVHVASLEDLIAMKKAAGRPKDLVAVEELEAIRRLLRERS
jgi:Nucleotidyltransferase of unknown function (DUF6036)